jgi:hypothetical protein
MIHDRIEAVVAGEVKLVKLLAFAGDAGGVM